MRPPRWERCGTAADVHVVPVKDLREHTETRDCWCHPDLVNEWRTVVVVHNALDGRELVERTGLQ